MSRPRPCICSRCAVSFHGFDAKYCSDCLRIVRAEAIRGVGVKPSTSEIGREYYRWTKSAVDCYESRQNCAECPVGLAIDFAQHVGACKMPEAVDYLLNKYGPPAQATKGGLLAN